MYTAQFYFTISSRDNRHNKVSVFNKYFTRRKKSLYGWRVRNNAMPLLRVSLMIYLLRQRTLYTQSGSRK